MEGSNAMAICLSDVNSKHSDKEVVSVSQTFDGLNEKENLDIGIPGQWPHQGITL